MNKRFRFVLISVFIFMAFVFISCNKSKSISAIEEEELFTLNYGSFEDELNMFDLSSVGIINTSLCMQNGFFFIANGESKKIMEFNSYGDLLTLIYNAESNPSPTFINEGEENSATRKAVSYPFNDISSIAVDERKYLYVVDKMPQERQELDELSGQVLSQIVLRFDGSGKFMDYLGQQGPGGTPFPYVSAIYTTENLELVVISKTSNGMIAFWFSKEGRLLYKVPVENRNIPNLYKNEKNDYWFTFENIVPDLYSKTLYLKVDYYSSYVDEASRVQSGITYESSCLYPLDVETGVYGEVINVLPYREQLAEGLSKESYDVPYDFLGVTSSGWLFFIVSTENGFSIEMMQENGQRILKRRIPLSHKDNLFYSFNLSSEGILSVLRVQKDKAIVDWWRTDDLVQSVLKN